MIKIPMSVAAAGLLRALLARAHVSRDRILLTAFQSTEWQSLTFIGERHRLRFRIPGPAAGDVVRDLTNGLEDAEFSIPGNLVADIALVGKPQRADDGSVSVELEALTIAE
jgi:hypothetical protein